MYNSEKHINTGTITNLPTWFVITRGHWGDFRMDGDHALQWPFWWWLNHLAIYLGKDSTVIVSKSEG